MSQVSFYATMLVDLKPVKIEVMSGWDRPLGYYHFTIFNLDPKGDETVYSCLDEPGAECFVKHLDKWKNKLKEFGIEAPEGFWERAELKAGNYLAKYHNDIGWEDHHNG